MPQQTNAASAAAQAHSSQNIEVVVLRYYRIDGVEKTPTAWPKKKLAEYRRPTARHMPLDQALTEEFDHPAFIVARMPTKVPHRHGMELFSNAPALEYIGGAVKMQLFLADVDHPRHTDANLTPEEVECPFAPRLTTHLH